LLVNGVLSRAVTSGLCIRSERGREREMGGGLPIDNDWVEDKEGGNGRRSDDDRWEGAFTPLKRCKTIYAL